jgi:hypothetical protein
MPAKFSVELFPCLGHNQSMETIPPEILADMKHAVELAMSGKKDPEFERRIHEEAAKIRDEIFRNHGYLDIGVPAIRELRDNDE